MTEPSLIRQATASGTEMPLTASGTDLASDGQVLKKTTFRRTLP